MNKITLEDINTWLIKYEYQTLVLTLDCSQNGDYDLYQVSDYRTGGKKVLLKLQNVKLYYPSGEIKKSPATGTIFLTSGDYQLTVVLNSLNNKNIEITEGELDWYPVSPLKCLSLPNDDLSNKLYLDIKDDRITHINNVKIQDLTGEPYVPYNIITEGSLSTNVSDTTVYPSKLITIPSCPHITIEKELYKGNYNSITDLISLPLTDIEYKIYYNGKELKDNIFIPRDYDEDTIHLRVVTKSYEPYIGTDVFIDVPVTTKLLKTLEDLNTYSYGKVETLNNLNGEINNDITITGGVENTLNDCNLIINGNLKIEKSRTIMNTKIINNGRFELTFADILMGKEIYVNNYSNNYKWVNNGTLIIDNANIRNYNGFLLNNGSFKLTNSKCTLNVNNNLPIIHSINNNIELKNNEFQFKSLIYNYEGYEICLIRSNNFDADKFLSENTTDYDGIYINDNKTYAITGNGVAYCLIDDDIIRFKNLEVTEDEDV